MKFHFFRKIHRALKHDEYMSNPTAVRNTINSPGKELDTTTQASMESRFNRDFSDVRVHTDTKAAESTGTENARAYTVGNHIAFNTSEYKPGSLEGDALIAHELAHVVQQTGEGSALTAGKVPGQDDQSLEKEADAAALRVVAAGPDGSKAVGNRIAQGMMPGQRTGLRLQRCARSQSIQAPSFLGAQSRETLDRINRIMEAGGALQQWIAFGQTITSFENPLQALETAEAAEAIAAVPVIVKARVRQEIELLLVTHGDELSAEERTFWEQLLARF